MKIETLINTYINKAVKGKQAYYDNLQTAYEIFVAHYNTDLNHNSTPLLNILKACGKDITKMKEYVINSTNITALKMTPKGGLQLVFSGEFTFNNGYIDSNKWFDKLVKADKQAIKELEDDNFIKIIKGLLKRLDNSNKVTHKDTKKALLNKLLTA